MTDLHRMVIDDMCQVIYRVSVRPHQNKVIQCFVLERQLTPDEVVKLGVSHKRGPEPNHRSEAVGLGLAPLAGSEVATMTVVHRRQLILLLLFADSVETFGGAVTQVSRPAF